MTKQHAPVSPPPSSTPTQSGPAPGTSEASQPVFHTVARGDSLWKIAARHLGDGNRWREIAEANDLDNPDRIAIGQQLRIPSPADDGPPSASEVATAGVEQSLLFSFGLPPGATLQLGQPVDTLEYTVKRGDTLWEIAKRYYDDPGRWRHIYRTNGLGSEQLAIGQQLTLTDLPSAPFELDFDPTVPMPDFGAFGTDGPVQPGFGDFALAGDGVLSEYVAGGMPFVLNIDPEAPVEALPPGPLDMPSLSTAAPAAPTAPTADTAPTMPAASAPPTMMDAPPALVVPAGMGPAPTAPPAPAALPTPATLPAPTPPALSDQGPAVHTTAPAPPTGDQTAAADASLTTRPGIDAPPTLSATPPTLGAGQGPDKGPSPEGGEAAQAEAEPERQLIRGQFVVTDPQALIRTNPPELASIGSSLAVGTEVNVIERVRKGRRNYVRVAAVDWSPEDSAWTSEANLSPAKAVDPTLAAKNKIPLEGLRGLQRRVANTYNNYGDLLEKEARDLNIDVALAVAILDAESGGKAFGKDGRMIIRFENHKFRKYLGASRIDEYRAHFSDKGWDAGHVYRTSPEGEWKSVHGSGQAGEWRALDLARTIDDSAAIQSISMGAGQVMGFHYAEKFGYDTPQQMLEAFQSGIRPQLEGVFEFIRRTPLCLRGLANEDYEMIAAGYNGNGQKKKYGGIIRRATAAFRAVRGSAVAPTTSPRPKARPTT